MLVPVAPVVPDEQSATQWFGTSVVLSNVGVRAQHLYYSGCLDIVQVQTIAAACSDRVSRAITQQSMWRLYK